MSQSLEDTTCSEPHNKQQSSHFFKLAPELRLIIYKNITADLSKRVHIFNFGRLSHVACKADSEDPEEFEMGLTGTRTKPWGSKHSQCFHSIVAIEEEKIDRPHSESEHVSPLASYRATSATLFSMMLVCRLM